jgi:iron-sulfur cluster assembly protein
MKNSITLTEKAAQMILDVIDAQELKNPYLELRVVGGGCSGLQYGLGLTEIIDYIDMPMGAGFKVNNPNATKSCGCGASFSTDDSDVSELNEGKGCGSCKS